MSVLLIYNNSAGSGDVSRDDLLKCLRAGGYDPEAVSSDDERLPGLLGQPRDLLVVAGGDGTVARVLTGLAERSTPIAILPTGGSNNIARAMGVEGELAELAAGLGSASLAELHIGVAEGVWGRARFVEAAGFGALTAALLSAQGSADETQAKLRIGRAALAEAVAAAEPVPYRLELDGRAVQEELLMLEVLNIASIGPRLPLAPGAKAGDGKFQVARLAPADRDRFLSWLECMDDDPPVIVTQAREIRLLAGPEEVRLDDPKRVRPREGQPVYLHKEQNPVRILVPQTPGGRS